MKHIVYIILAAAILSSCNRDGDSKPLSVHRLDSELFEGKVPQDSLMADAASKLFLISGYGELTDSSLTTYISKPIINMSRARMDSVWGTTDAPSASFSSLESSLGKLSAAFAKELPQVKMPRVFSVISPFNQSVFTVDSTMFIGLNHYLGADYGLYDYFPDYIRLRKEPARVIPDVAESLIRRDFPYTSQSEYPTVVSRLIYEGSVVEAVCRLTGLSPQSVLGYSNDQWAWLEKNEKEMWEALAARKLLFSTDEMNASMLVGLSPATTILNIESPGYAGRFIGYRIVRSYLDENSTPLQQLLEPSFYDDAQTLSRSAYVP